MWASKEDEWAFRSRDGDMTVYDKVCLGVVSTSSLLSYGKHQSSLVDETPGEGSYDT